MPRTREELLAAKKIYREKNKEKIAAYAKEYNRTKRKRKLEPNKPGKAYKRLYGITELDFQEMLKKQNGVCKICGQPETIKRNGKVKRLSIDHCHKTGQVRGLLCHICNITLGKYKEEIATFQKFIDYLSTGGG